MYRSIVSAMRVLAICGAVPFCLSGCFEERIALGADAGADAIGDGGRYEICGNGIDDDLDGLFDEGCTTAETCGGPEQIGCPEAQYCDFGQSQAPCGVNNASGVCRGYPEGDFDCGDIQAPVCGCDGRTYDNDCRAYLAQVSVRSQGACAANPEEFCLNELDDNGDGQVDEAPCVCSTDFGLVFLCNGQCVDGENNVNNCGQCGISCDDGNALTSDRCVDAICMHAP